MRKTTKIQQPVIYFRRWSRKAYAAFCSIGRCVSIGRLRKNVVEASLKKQKADCSFARELTGRTDAGEEAEEPDSLTQLLTVVIHSPAAVEAGSGEVALVGVNRKSIMEPVGCSVLYPAGFFICITKKQ
ncbi:MAG: hypothetical protein LBL57_02745 [Tannerella sp.]|jgi:hypothetical protein|nr:hypothetical protein [Tannerella sp.]